MKVTIATTFIGSQRSAMIHANAPQSPRFGDILIALATLLTLCGCDPSDAGRANIDSKIEQACGKLCERGRFRAFSDRAVHLEIEPTGETSQVFYNINPNTMLSQPVVLHKAAHLSGQAVGADLSSSSNNSTTNRDKDDAFFDILAIPELNRISFLSPRVPTAKSRLQSSGNYDIDLLHGLAYTIILNPGGERDRAPIHINTGVIADDTHFDFEANKNPTHIFGRVLVNDMLANADNGLPHIQARLMLGTRLISSVNRINAAGEFSLEVSNPIYSDASGQPINLIIEPIDFETALPRIKHKLDMDVLKSDFDVGDINLGTLKKPVQVGFEVRGSDDSLISNASIYLRAPIGAGVAIIKKQVNKMGETKLNHLYEGRYDIAIIPPVDSKFAMRVIKDVEFDSREGIQISVDLQKRDGLIAHVFGPLGQRVSGAQIQFSRIGEIGNFATEDIYDDNLFKLTATTNDQGKICHRKYGISTADKNECSALLLDEGRYLAHIIPPAGSELAHKWITFDFPEKNELSIMLEQPEILVGQILKHDGKTPLAKAFVTVYLAETNMLNEPKMIGNAITDDRGFYRAFVSAP